MSEEQAAKIVIGKTVFKGLAMSAIILAGILYNLYTAPNVLARAFAPAGLPLWLGYFFVYGGFFLTLWCGVRLLVLWRKPLVAFAAPQGLTLKGIGLVPWPQVERLWFGAPFGDKQQRYGTCLFVDMCHVDEAQSKVHFFSFGFLPDKVIYAEGRLRLRYWMPFVFFTQKEAFHEAVKTYCPEAIRKADEGIPMVVQP